MTRQEEQQIILNTFQTFTPLQQDTLLALLTEINRCKESSHDMSDHDMREFAERYFDEQKEKASSTPPSKVNAERPQTTTEKPVACDYCITGEAEMQ